MHCRVVLKLLFVGLALCISTLAMGHDLSSQNAQFVQGLSGANPGPFLYLGAKHMFTGYDHLLFILGVIFFLYRPRDIILFVTLFTLGHSTTLMLGVFFDWQVSAYLVDAIIGLSVAYKAFENMKGFDLVLPWHLDTRVAVFAFGLCHGLGLATKLQDYVDREDGLLSNLVSFNIGVELGQICALAAILLVLTGWRRLPVFNTQAFAVNVVLMCAGFVLFGYQLAGYFLV